MNFTILDWTAIAAYLLITLFLGLYFRSRSGKSMDDYFLSGRSVSWWLAGTSMVATTFAANTPLVVTGLVGKNGIPGNWVWWSVVASGSVTGFLKIRFSGNPAAFLRGFRALYLGIPINCIILGWVNLAMVKILMLVLGVDKLTALLVVMGLIAVTGMISTISGLWGVLVTDVL